MLPYCTESGARKIAEEVVKESGGSQPAAKTVTFTFTSNYLVNNGSTFKPVYLVLNEDGTPMDWEEVAELFEDGEVWTIVPSNAGNTGQFAGVSVYCEQTGGGGFGRFPVNQCIYNGESSTLCVRAWYLNHVNVIKAEQAGQEDPEQIETEMLVITDGSGNSIYGDQIIGQYTGGSNTITFRKIA